jgi:hypothetical protein
VNVSVFPSAVVETVFGHRDLGTVEHRGFVHVVPNVNVRSGTFELVQAVEGLVVVLHFRVEQVGVAAGAGPTPSFKKNESITLKRKNGRICTFVNVSVFVLNVIIVG